MSDAALSLDFPAEWLTSRRPRVPVEELVEDWGPLGAEHVAAVQAHIAAGSPTTVRSADIVKLRHTHHRLAQLLTVGGCSDTMAANVCGYSVSRVSILKADPAFKELMAHYAETREEAFIDTVEQMAGVTSDLVQRFREFLEDDKLTPQMTLEGIKVIGDRGGLAPVSRSVNVNIHTGMGDRLRAGRERAAQAELRQITNVSDIPDGG